MSVIGREQVLSMETWILVENAVCWLRTCSMSQLRTGLSSGMGIWVKNYQLNLVYNAIGSIVRILLFNSTVDGGYFVYTFD